MLKYYLVLVTLLLSVSAIYSQELPVSYQGTYSSMAKSIDGGCIWESRGIDFVELHDTYAMIKVSEYERPFRFEYTRVISTVHNNKKVVCIQLDKTKILQISVVDDKQVMIQLLESGTEVERFICLKKVNNG